jgi:hypothetical protein
MANETKKRVASVFNELADAIETGDFGANPKIGLTILESEHGPQELVSGAEQAVDKYENMVDLERMLCFCW